MKTERNTKQKKAVLDAVLSLKDHPSAAEVFSEVQKTIPNVSRATVYRILQDASRNGQIKKVYMTDCGDRFDFNTDMHYHIKCTGCGKLADIMLDMEDYISGKASAKTDYDLEGFNLEFFGLCPKCKENGKEVTNE